MQIDINVVPEGYPDKGPYGVTMKFRHDNGRAEWRGRIFKYDEYGNIDPNMDHTINEIFTGKRHISFGNPVKESLRGALVSTDFEEDFKDFMENPTEGGPLWGRIYGNNHKTIAELLAESKDLTMHQEVLDNTPCFVLEGTTKYGRTTAWIDPQMNYSALKWTIEKKSGDLFNDKPKPIDSWLAEFDLVRFIQIDGQFIPEQALFNLKTTLKDGQKHSSRQEYKISNIRLNPDFKSMGAFEADLPNGLRIYSKEVTGIKYKWKDGEVVPDVDGATFEEIDTMMDEIKKENK